MKIKPNKVVNEVDALKNELDALNLEMSSLQREKDLKVNTISHQYENKIDKVLRRIEFVKMQMEQAKEYAKKNLQGGNQ